MNRILRHFTKRSLPIILMCSLLPQLLNAQQVYASADTQHTQRADHQVVESVTPMLSLGKITELAYQKYALRFIYGDNLKDQVQLPASILRKKKGQFIQAMESALLNRGFRLTKTGAQQYGITRQSQQPVKKTVVLPDPEHITVTGTVKDKLGNPLVGVTVRVKGQANGTYTNDKGFFSLSVKPADSLEISYVGYQTQVLAVRNHTKIDVILEANTGSLNEVVVVAYGKQKKATVTGAISTIQGKELKQSPAANLAVSLAGRLPGLTAIQTSGEPGRDATLLYLRGQGTINGQNPLILVDGVPRDLTYIDPNEVASITILKDASATAMYGVQGANGVILVTTKRGKDEKPEINFSIERGFQGFTRLPSTVNAYQYVTLRNQAAVNDGLGEYYFYTKEAVQHYKSHDEPTVYFDNDWPKMLMRKYTPQTRYNMNLTGGGEYMKYFVNAGYLDQGGIWKIDQKDYPNHKRDYDPSEWLKRYNFRSNVDIYLDRSKTLKAFLNAAGYFEKINGPAFFNTGGASVNYNLFSFVYSTPPTQAGPLTPDGEVVANTLYWPPYGVINRSGYTQEKRTNITASFGMEQDLKFITPGLSAKFMMSFDTRTIYDMIQWQQFRRYIQKIGKTADGRDTSIYQRFTTDENTPLSPITSASFQSFTEFEFFLNYKRTFGGKHTVTGLLLGQQQQRIQPGIRLPFNHRGISTRITYGYDNRYFAEFNAGFNGSEQFAKGQRYGFFPAFSAAWLVSNEQFMKNTNNVLNLLKLRASYGLVGNDQLGGRRFLYLDNIKMGGGGFSTYLGKGQTVNENSLGNPDISWEIAKKVNIGLDLGLFDQLKLTVDVFHEKRDNMLISRQSVPALNGLPVSSLPPVNLGRMENHGYEIELNYHKSFNRNLSVIAKLNFNHAKNKVLFMDEVERPADYAYRYVQTGYSLGQNWGFVADGYWNSQKEIDNSGLTFQGTQPRPGDLKFKDLNGDLIIDAKDVAPIGYTAVPQYTYGAAFSINYKNFDLSVLFQGVAEVSHYFTGWGVYSNEIIPSYRSRMLEAWTPERAEKGLPIKFPALSTGIPSSEAVNNSFFLENTSYIRLKNAEIGYTLPVRWSKKIGSNKIRFYTNGLNIYTWTKMKNTDFDPEESQYGTLTYPIEKVFNFGVNIVF